MGIPNIAQQIVVANATAAASMTSQHPLLPSKKHSSAAAEEEEEEVEGGGHQSKPWGPKQGRTSAAAAAAKRKKRRSQKGAGKARPCSCAEVRSCAQEVRSKPSHAPIHRRWAPVCRRRGQSLAVLLCRGGALMRAGGTVKARLCSCAEKVGSCAQEV